MGSGGLRLYLSSAPRYCTPVLYAPDPVAAADIPLPTREISCDGVGSGGVRRPHPPPPLTPRPQAPLFESLHGLRTALTGWAFSCYIRAALLARPNVGRRRGFVPYARPMSQRLRQLLTAYNIAVFYIAIRTLVAGPGGVLGVAARRIAAARRVRRGGKRRRSLAAMLAVAFVGADELAHMLCVASLDVGRTLVDGGGGKRSGDDACCICFEAEGKLGRFCTASEAHVAHQQCMGQWVECGLAGSSRCPVCRAPLRIARPSLPVRMASCAATPSYWWLLAVRAALSSTTTAAAALVFAAL